jgi:Tfp pilus assembly protein PilN
MKLQFNLLPDVKQEYLKTQRTKRTIITASIVASAIALFIFILMLTTVYVINKKQLSDANKQIDKYTDQLKAIPNLDKILTVQNQLKSLSGLHASKHMLSRVFSYIPQVTPQNVCLGKLSVDLAQSSMMIEGTADSQKSINTFVDTLKFTKYQIDNKDTGKNAFSSVVESQFGIVSSAQNDVKCDNKAAPASYQLTIQYDPSLFLNSDNVALTVPQGLVTTRSVLDNPSNIFNGKTGNSSASPATNSNTSGRQ